MNIHKEYFFLLSYFISFKNHNSFKMSIFAAFINLVNVLVEKGLFFYLHDELTTHFQCMDFCHSMHSNLPSYYHIDDTQKYFIEKSKIFAETDEIYAVLPEYRDTKNLPNLKHLEVKNAGHAHAKFVWSQKIGCSDMRYPHSDHIGTGQTYRVFFGQI